jgi:hypothetical protein
MKFGRIAQEIIPVKRNIPCNASVNDTRLRWEIIGIRRATLVDS